MARRIKAIGAVVAAAAAVVVVAEVVIDAADPQTEMTFQDQLILSEDL